MSARHKLQIVEDNGSVDDGGVGVDGGPLAGLPVPSPVPDMDAYLRERRIRLSRSTARLDNYIKLRAAKRGSVELDYMPVKLDIENASRCNFRCTMCTVSEWPKGKRAEDLPLAEFKRLIDENQNLVEIKLQGLGEPTLQGDDYFAMIGYARSQHIWVRTTTNASLLHLNDNYKRLIDSGVNEVQISIDGADAETYTSIRRGAVFDRVVENCTLINGYCESLGIERTKIWTVVQRGNRHQLPALVDLAHKLKFRHMVFSLNLGDFGLAKWRERNDAVTVESEITRFEAEELVARGAKLGINVSFWNVTSKYSTDRVENLCPWPFERAAISSDLRVVPCCIIGNPDVSELGDGRDFAKVWNGDAYRKFRQAHLDGEIPQVCRGCYRDPNPQP